MLTVESNNTWESALNLTDPPTIIRPQGSQKANVTLTFPSAHYQSESVLNRRKKGQYLNYDYSQDEYVYDANIIHTYFKTQQSFTLFVDMQHSECLANPILTVIMLPSC